MKLSKNFTLEEMIYSATAINKNIYNSPSEKVIENLKLLCENVLQPAREALGAIEVSSGYRSVALNLSIGGVPSSQHCKGQASDIKGIDKLNSILFDYIRENLDFDQLIWEFGNLEPKWIHVSFNEGHNRKEVLKAYKLWNGKTGYKII